MKEIETQTKQKQTHDINMKHKTWYSDRQQAALHRRVKIFSTQVKFTLRPLTTYSHVALCVESVTKLEVVS